MNLKRITLWVFIISFIIILFTIMAYVINGFLNPFNILSTEKLGQFGDFVGGFAGVILTFLATVLIYLTYNSQKKELKLSIELFSKQNFENTFFKMLSVHQDLKKEILYEHGDLSAWCMTTLNFGQKEEVREYKGRGFFGLAEKELRCLWEKGKPIEHTIDEHLKFVLELKYPIFWKKYANYLGDYFRNIYHILKFVSEEKSVVLEYDTSVDKEKTKESFKKYADILQSQLNFSELFLIFYNTLNYPKMKKLVEEFNFIENLHINNLLHPKHAEFKGIGNLKRDKK